MAEIEASRIIEAAKDLLALQVWLKVEYPHVSKPWMRKVEADLLKRLEDEIVREVKRHRKEPAL